MPRASRKKPIVRLIERIGQLTTELRALPRAELYLVSLGLQHDEISAPDLARLRAATDEFCETLACVLAWSDQLHAAIGETSDDICSSCDGVEKMGEDEN